MRQATSGGPPRYVEIIRAISDDITTGRIAVGERLPTEKGLCAQYNVGRHTIREAVRGLIDLGMVQRRPRIGTSVISAEPVAGYRWVPGSAADIAANMNATWIVRGQETVVVADGELAARLSCDVGERWFRFAGPRILRDRSVREPLCFSEQYVQDTPRGREAIRTPSMTPASLDDQVVEQQILASALNAEQAAALNAVTGSPALVVVRRHYNAEGTLLAVGIHSHPGDRFSITMTIPVGTSNGNSLSGE
ncbi:GntR family transcriptional regulator [Nocardia sp. NBC_00565]|uniref:GntR family transcriptional regulator n=1 Tax=Nocardia sp. NBC_00565 TaxID=2975993 RepID=UPI002E8004DC|nr:GntR family transcriptional regulator [Nocardia sp. NBC_00565]WUC01918.1 GntR family transcriptional regulator [Nocardia sp. NBC_00565]